MLRKRIIFTLIYSDGYFMQSRNFRLQRVGDLNWLMNNYKFDKISWAIDELIILDASRSNKDKEKFAGVVDKISQNVFIPVAAGGGISEIFDAERLFNSGADKIVLNTAVYKDQKLVSEIVRRYGAQSLVASVDYKKVGNSLQVFIENGITPVEVSFLEYLKLINDSFVGEIFLNSIDKDGTGFGFDFETICYTSELINMPLIVSGGAGKAEHLDQALQMEKVSAVATANLFNFIGEALPKARKYILANGRNIRN